MNTQHRLEIKDKIAFRGPCEGPREMRGSAFRSTRPGARHPGNKHRDHRRYYLDREHLTTDLVTDSRGTVTKWLLQVPLSLEEAVLLVLGAPLISPPGFLCISVGKTPCQPRAGMVLLLVEVLSSKLDPLGCCTKEGSSLTEAEMAPERSPEPPRQQ